jgi:hypothetical protein
MSIISPHIIHAPINQYQNGQLRTACDSHVVASDLQPTLPKYRYHPKFLRMHPSARKRPGRAITASLLVLLPKARESTRLRRGSRALWHLPAAGG